MCLSTLRYIHNNYNNSDAIYDFMLYELFGDGDIVIIYITKEDTYYLKPHVFLN